MPTCAREKRAGAAACEAELVTAAAQRAAERRTKFADLSAAPTAAAAVAAAATAEATINGMSATTELAVLMHMPATSVDLLSALSRHCILLSAALVSRAAWK